MANIKAYKKANGKTYYMFTAYLGTDPITGKEKIVTRRGFENKTQARSTLTRLKYEFNNGLMTPTTSDTYQDIYDVWMETYKNEVKESTLRKTKGDFKNHILPEFADKKITKITPVDCQNFYNYIVPKLVNGKKVYNIARKCFDYAITPLGMVRDNPFDKVYKGNVKSPEKPKNKKKFLEKDELFVVLDKIKETQPYMWYVYFRLLAFTGLRKSEALALKWSDIDFNKSTVNITKTLAHGLQSKLIVSPPKTEASIREVSLDKDTLNILKDYIKVINLNQIIFPNQSGNYLQPARPNEVLKKVFKELPNIKPVTAKGFRHTHCSLLFDAGISIKEVQARLGHESINTTMDIYNHVTEYRKGISINKFEKYMNS